MLRNNVGTIDRVARALIGLALVIWAFAGGPVWAWIGVIPLVTAALGTCPLYSLLGLSSCPVSTQQH